MSLDRKTVFLVPEGGGKQGFRVRLAFLRFEPAPVEGEGDGVAEFFDPLLIFRYFRLVPAFHLNDLGQEVPARRAEEKGMGGLFHRDFRVGQGRSVGFPKAESGWRE